GKVFFSLRGSQVQFSVGSDQAVMAGKNVALPSPVILRISRPFIPVDFFTSDEFSNLAGSVSHFNPETRTLTIDNKVTVGPVEWFTYPGRTRVTLALAPEVQYSIVRQGLTGLRVDIPRGRIDSFASASIQDGIIQTLRLDQEPERNLKIARLSLRL